MHTYKTIGYHLTDVLFGNCIVRIICAVLFTFQDVSQYLYLFIK